MNKKKLLVITPRYPYPVIGGDRLRIYQICKELSKTHDLTLVSLCETKSELQSSLPDDNVFQEIHRVLLPKWRSYLNCLVGVFTNKPLQVSYYQYKPFQKLVDKLMPQHTGSLAHLVRTSEYVKDFPQNVKVLEYTDAISMNYERVKKQGAKFNFKHIVYSIEQSRLKRYERKIASHFNAGVFVSRYDANYLFSDEQQKALNIKICSNGIDLTSFPKVYDPKSRQLVFIGNLYSEQNLDAALWFSTDVLPSLRLHGDFTFKVIGKIREKDRQRLNRIEGVYSTGTVANVGEEAKNSLAGICSVRLGAGIQNKVLEYIAMDLPCISSTVGLEGFALESGASVFCANTPQEYIDRVLDIANNQQKAIGVAEQALDYVSKSHSWSAQLEELVQVFK